MRISKISDILLQVVLFLCITKLFSIFPLLGIPLKFVTPIIAVVSLGFISLNWKSTSFFLRKLPVQVWLLILCFFPLILNIIQIAIGYYNPDSIIRRSGILVTQGALFLSAIVFVWKNGTKKLSRIAISSLIFILVSFIIDSKFPGAFLIIKNYLYTGENKLDPSILDPFFVQRVSGFYFNPNAAGFALLLLYSLLIINNNSLKLSRILLYPLIISFAIFFTGSRGSMLSIPILIVSTGLFIRKYFQYKLNFNANASNFSFFSSFIIILIFIFSGFYFAYYELKDGPLKSLAERVLIFSPNSSDVIKNDDSINQRFIAQKEYAGRILKNPFIGYGPTYLNDIRVEKSSENVRSHNIYFEVIFKYGAFGLILYLLGIWMIIYETYRLDGFFTYVPVISMFLIILIAGISNSSILDFRFFSSSVGLMIGFLYYKR